MSALGYAETAEVGHLDDRAGAEALTAVAVAAAGGDDQAWRHLWETVEPRLLGLVRRPRFLGRLSLRDDDCRNVVLAVMERLYADDRRRLVAFASSVRADPSRQFWPWLVVVAKRVGIDYMRSHEQFIGRRGAPSESQPAWAHDTTASDLKMGGQRPAMTNRGTARQLLDIAAHTLSPPQRAALDLWLQGSDHAAIATELGLPEPRDGERLVRSGLERLRRAVRPKGDES